MNSNLAFAARHSMDSPEWYTPSPFVEAAREVMGGIDLDPMSCEEANVTVQATRFYTEAENGLSLPLFGRVFYNPAGDLVDEAWKQVVRYRDEIEAVVWIGYSLEQLQSLQAEDTRRLRHATRRATNLVTPLDFALCFPKRRIPFVENEAKRKARIEKIIAKGEAHNASNLARKAAANCRLGKPPKDAPSHANYISYIGPHVEQFARVFGQFGKVRL